MTNEEQKPYTFALASRLMRYKKGAKLSYRKLAELTGLNYCTLFKLCTGEHSTISYESGILLEEFLTARGAV